MSRTFNKVSVLGLGYIGLPTAAAIASRKVQVTGVDVDQTVVGTINRGEIHIVEPDLDIIVRSVVSEGYLRATIHPEAADAFLVAVPTPFKGDDHEPDLSYIEAATKSIAPVLEKGNLVVLESTSPVGATENLAEWLAEARPDLSFPQSAGELSDIRIAHCPERVLPGHILSELVENDRVVGGMTPACSKAAIELYKIFVQGDCFVTNARLAEMAKLTENSFRDVNIAIANELSIICDELDIDVRELISLANRHPRVNILNPGPGVGGHCIAVDPWFIVNRTPKAAKLFSTARDVNDLKPRWVAEKIAAAGSDEEIILLGMAYKADVDDMRESPSIAVVKHLISLVDPSRVCIVDPFVSTIPADIKNSGVRLMEFETAFGRSALLAILVAHRQFIDNRDRFASADVLDFCGCIP